MKGSHRAIGLTIGIIATVAFAWYAVHALRDVDLARFTSTRALLGIAIAAFFYASIIPISAWAWRQLLRGSNVRRSWRELVEIMAITQMAKYVPGNVGVHLGRAAMSVAKGIPGRPLGISMMVETLLAVTAAVLVGLAGIALSGPGSRVLADEINASLWMTATVVVLILSLGLLLRFLVVPLVARFAPRHTWLLSDGIAPDPIHSAQGFAAYAANYVFIGIGIALMSYVLLPEIAHDPALLCASFAIAWVAGFFTPGAPAGLGVREGLMLIILASAYDKADALVIVIALRLATMLGDTLSFLAGYLLLLDSRKRSSAT